jgi:hypothetical protein
VFKHPSKLPKHEELRITNEKAYEADT